MVNAGSLVRESRGFSDALSSVISEVENTYSYVQGKMHSSSKKSQYESILENYYKTLKQLAEQNMNRRRRKLSEADITLKLTGVPEDIELDDLGIDIITGGTGDEGGDEDEELDLDDEEESEEEEEEGGDEELDLDLGGEEEEEEGGKQESQGTVEIDEGMLRREIWRMKKLRESQQKSQRHQKGHGAGSVSDDFEDDDLGDPFTKVKLREKDAEAAEAQHEIEELEQEVDQIQQEVDHDKVNESWLSPLASFIGLDDVSVGGALKSVGSSLVGHIGDKLGLSSGERAVADNIYDALSGRMSERQIAEKISERLGLSEKEASFVGQAVEKLGAEQDTSAAEAEKGPSTQAEADEMDEIQVEMDEEDVDEMQQDMDEVDESAVQVEMDEEDVDEMQQEADEMDEAEDPREYGGNVAQKSAGPGAATNKQSRHPGQTVESLQHRIRREISLQMEAKRKAQSAKKQAQRAAQVKQESQKKAQQSRRQGKMQTEKQALQHMKQANKMQKQMQEAYAFYARRFNESVSRINRLRGVLTEVARRGRTLNGAPARSAAGTSHLRTKLAETNLINTKLYYTNRLLQNESLTKRQKAAVIERLDEANSDREVKLVYESLIRTLQGSSSSDLTESVNRGVMGSSSRPARPASATLTEGFETERWARLAGIVK
jgi:hypothetical protein